MALIFTFIKIDTDIISEGRMPRRTPDAALIMRVVLNSSSAFFITPARNAEISS